MSVFKAYLIIVINRYLKAEKLSGKIEICPIQMHLCVFFHETSKNLRARGRKTENLLTLALLVKQNKNLKQNILAMKQES